MKNLKLKFWIFSFQMLKRQDINVFHSLKYINILVCCHFSYHWSVADCKSPVVQPAPPNLKIISILNFLLVPLVFPCGLVSAMIQNSYYQYWTRLVHTYNVCDQSVVPIVKYIDWQTNKLEARLSWADSELRRDRERSGNRLLFSHHHIGIVGFYHLYIAFQFIALSMHDNS